MLSGIAAIIAIYGFMTAQNPAMSTTLLILFIPALALFFFLPFINKENEIINKGPIFAAINSLEKDKTGYILIKKTNIPVFEVPAAIPSMSKIVVRSLGGLWSKEDEKAYIKLILNDMNGCKNTVELMYSNQIPQNNTENYRDITKMKPKNKLISNQCNSEINKISIFIDPGTWALSLSHIKVFMVEKISIFSFIKQNYLT
jgi:hypothetical protein